MYSSTTICDMPDLLLKHNGDCFTPDESDTQHDLRAIKDDEVVLISQTGIIADE